MKAEKLLDVKVVEAASGANIGRVKGLLVDSENKQVAALAVGDSGMFKGIRYLPFGSILMIEDSRLTVPSRDVVVDRSRWPDRGMLDSLVDLEILMEDGTDIGKTCAFSFDDVTGKIESVSFYVNKQALAGRWKSAEDSYDIPRPFIRSLGGNIVVDERVPTALGMDRRF